ncbi:MAG: site-specific integrase, partial [Bifidobacteriaceae bacterium]|nr:site-specific integrase [Bifidobacteriaceae bacterium]
MNQSAPAPAPWREAVLDRFAAALRGEGLAPRTIVAYTRDVADLLHRLAVDTEAELAALKLDDLREWLAFHVRRGDAKASLARRGSSAKRFFRWALSQNLIRADQSVRLQTPVPGRTLPRVLAQSEAKRMMDQAAAAAAGG